LEKKKFLIFNTKKTSFRVFTPGNKIKKKTKKNLERALYDGGHM